MPKKLKIFLFSFLFFPLFVFAQGTKFYVDPNYDLYQREEIFATEIETSQRAHFFVDNDFLEFLTETQKAEIQKSLKSLGEEFDKKIYPVLTQNFGTEWTPGIDGDPKITILFHKMRKDAAGYFHSGDEYPKIQNPKSNQREMVYLNADNISSPLLKSFLAHEFVHLITFNQKNRNFGVEEETWLNEARAEYAPTLLGYDDEGGSTYLQMRINQFLKKPTDSIVEWSGEPADYGALNLFTHYLVERFGKEILIDSLHRKETGIASIDATLKDYGLKDTFSQTFIDWTITVLINDCEFDPKYCYKNKNLRNLRLLPEIVFLPLSGEAELSSQKSTQNFAGNWIRFIGGSEDLKIKFDGMGNFFRVPYITQDRSGNYKIDYFTLDENQKGEILIKNFRKEIVSVTIIPVAQTKISDFKGENLYFAYQAKIVKHEEKESEEISKLLAQIEQLKQQIAFYQQKINEILGKSQPISCKRIEKNLYYGLINDPQVRCLQEFLKAQGPEIYPEGLVTGNFLNLTKQAVIRFQEKYKEEILKPLGLEFGTGLVGPLTRAKINQLLQH
jgi:peptidoglycan hydrolase-like protein with peptidoglycan-binding domain